MAGRGGFGNLGHSLVLRRTDTVLAPPFAAIEQVVIDACSKLIAMGGVRHASRPALAGVCAVHGTPMHSSGAVSNPRADCFPDQRSAAPFYLALRFFRAFVRLSRVIRLGDTKDLDVAGRQPRADVSAAPRCLNAQAEHTLSTS